MMSCSKEQQLGRLRAIQLQTETPGKSRPRLWLEPLAAPQGWCQSHVGSRQGNPMAPAGRREACPAAPCGPFSEDSQLLALGCLIGMAVLSASMWKVVTLFCSRR